MCGVFVLRGEVSMAALFPTETPVDKYLLQRIRSGITYHPDTGIFTRNGRPAGSVRKDWDGNPACRTIKLFGKSYYEHRLAYMWMTGFYPIEVIDHIDGNPLNNRWDNLRSVTQEENLKNTRVPKTNKYGVMGVKPSGNGRWAASIRVSKETVPLGVFSTFEEAVSIRKSAEELFGFHPNHNTKRNP